MRTPGPPSRSPRALPSPQTMLEEHAELSQMQEQVLSLAVSAMREGIEYSTSFEEQNHLWREDPAEFLRRFLALGSGPGPEEPQLEEPPAGGTPTLQMFQQEVCGGCSGCGGCPRRCRPWAVTGSHPQIDAYEELCQEVSEFSNTELFRGWLRCNCRPFKQALLAAIRRRGQVLRQHLSNHVTTRWGPAALARGRGQPVTGAWLSCADGTAVCQGRAEAPSCPLGHRCAAWGHGQSCRAPLWGESLGCALQSDPQRAGGQP